MAKRTRKPANKPAATKTNKTSGGSAAPKGKVTKPEVKAFMEEQRLTVSVGMSADYGKVKVGLSLSKNLKEGADPLAVAGEIYDALVEKCEEQYDAICEKMGIDEGYEDDGFEGGEEDPGDEGGFEDEGGEDEGGFEDEGGEEGSDEDCDDITEEEIMKMTKKECVQLIKDEGLDLTVSRYKNIADLREACVDAIFEPEEGSEEGGEEDGEWDDGEWED